MQGLEGKRIVVTGGTSGIGEATSRRFVAEGARVLALAVGADEVETAAERIPGLRAALRCDVSDRRQVADAFARVDDLLGGLDVLVANAGISVRAPFLEIEEADWQRVLDVNLTGVFHCTQQAARRMHARNGGVILVTASTNGTTFVCSLYIGTTTESSGTAPGCRADGGLACIGASYQPAERQV